MFLIYGEFSMQALLSIYSTTVVRHVQCTARKLTVVPRASFATPRFLIVFSFVGTNVSQPILLQLHKEYPHWQAFCFLYVPVQLAGSLHWQRHARCTFTSSSDYVTNMHASKKFREVADWTSWKFIIDPTCRCVYSRHAQQAGRH